MRPLGAQIRAGLEIAGLEGMLQLPSRRTPTRRAHRGTNSACLQHVLVLGCPCSWGVHAPWQRAPYMVNLGAGLNHSGAWPCVVPGAQGALVPHGGRVPVGRGRPRSAPGCLHPVQRLLVLPGALVLRCSPRVRPATDSAAAL